MWRLRAVNGRFLLVRRLPCTLGSDEGADLIVRHRSIQPMHARLRSDEAGRLVVEAIGGAVVGRGREAATEARAEARVSEGDELLLGSVIFAVERADGEEPPAAARPAAPERAAPPPVAAPKPAAPQAAPHATSAPPGSAPAAPKTPPQSAPAAPQSAPAASESPPQPAPAVPGAAPAAPRVPGSSPAPSPRRAPPPPGTSQTSPSPSRGAPPPAVPPAVAASGARTRVAPPKGPHAGRTGKATLAERAALLQSAGRPRKTGLLQSDFAQLSGTTKLLLVLVVLAAAAGLAWAISFGVRMLG